MKVIRKLFRIKKSKKGKSKPKKSKTTKSGGSATSSDSASISDCESKGGSQSSASVLERTRIHISTVMDPPTPKPVVEAEEAPEGAPTTEQKQKLSTPANATEKQARLSSRLACCKTPPPKEAELEPKLEAAAKKMAARVAKKPEPEEHDPKPFETIECVFFENRPGNLPSLIESLSMSTGASMDSTASNELFDMQEASHPPQPCRCGVDCMPPLNPEHWPQAPLLLRPDPKSSTRVLGIRKDGSSKYLWKPGSPNTWWISLQQKWGVDNPQPDASPCCDRCVILPINNGNEPEGESLVADFDTDHFSGTLLMRLRDTEGTTPEPADSTKGFFAGVPFRYEAVVRGHFKSEIPYTELVTGTRLSRPCGKLPPKWITWTALKVMGFFAPQLKAKLEGDQPFVLAPLGSGPRVVEVDDEPPMDLLGGERLEPTTPERSLTGKAYAITDHLERARARKRQFDKLCINKDKTLKTDPSKTYTMQFLQHLLDYKKFSLDLGNAVEFSALELLDGQPLQLMAAHGDQSIFGFEIWNEALIEDAKRHAFAERNKGWSVKYTSEK